MRTMCVLALSVASFAVLMSGCSSKNEGKLEGTYWSSLEMEYKGHKIPPGALRLEFRKDGSLTYQTLAGKLTGKYSYGWGDRVTFSLEQEIAGRKDHVEKIVVNDKQMTVTDSDGTSATFRMLGNW